nr:MAG TPA: hypothetical protein [Bacteriophage sp.]
MLVQNKTFPISSCRRACLLTFHVRNYTRKFSISQ